MKNKNMLPKLTFAALLYCVSLGFVTEAKCEQSTNSPEIATETSQKSHLNNNCSKAYAEREQSTEDIKKHRSQFCYERANAYVESGNIGKAIEDYTIALEQSDEWIQEHRVQVYYGRAEAYVKSKNMSKATEDYIEALRLAYAQRSHFQPQVYYEP